MTRKEKVMIWAAVIVILVGGFLALCIRGWTQTYGLPQEVIQGERMPTAEETIRLYFYYRNRNDIQAVRQLLTIHMAAEVEEEGENWLPMGHELLSIEPWDNNESEETATVMGFNVEEREGYLWTSPMSYNWNLGYELRRADVNHPWRIYFIGNG